MAQDFERTKLTAVGTTPSDIPTSADFDSDDTIIGINMANRTSNSITASCFMTAITNDDIAFDFNIGVTVGGNFVLDGNTKPALVLYRGFTYTFDVSSSTISSGSRVCFLLKLMEQIIQVIQLVLHQVVHKDQRMQRLH